MPSLDLTAFLEVQLARVRAFIKENRDPTDDEWRALNAIVEAELKTLSSKVDEA